MIKCDKAGALPSGTVIKTAADYLHAATSDNTRTAYKADIEHFSNWGGLLPSSQQTVSEYLIAHAGKLSVSTLTRRLAGLSAWHKTQGFADPTNSQLVKKIMKGIRREHNAPAKRANPLSLEHLEMIVSYLNSVIQTSGNNGIISADQEKVWLLAHRDKAMILLGFWRGFRADTLTDLRLEFIRPSNQTIHGQPHPTLDIFLPKSKGDREARGEHFSAPSMPGSPLCPVAAYEAWLKTASLENHKGFAFPKFNKEGLLSFEKIAPSSLSNWMKRLSKRAGIEGADTYSSHSLRRGLASLMAQKGADARVLMDHIGWKTASSALRYIDNRSGGIELLVSLTHQES